VVSAWRVHSVHLGSNPSMHKLRTYANSLVVQRSVTSWGAVDIIPVYLGSIREGGNGRRHPSSWVDLRAGHWRGYGPVTVSVVERISRMPKCIPDTSSTSVGVCVCSNAVQKKILNHLQIFLNTKVPLKAIFFIFDIIFRDILYFYI